jgi:hypothetical protein
MVMINLNLSSQKRAIWAGILILAAYSMLTYTFTRNVTLGVITDIISGIAVIGIPVLLFPFFHTLVNKTLNFIYIISRFIEGILMIIGGLFILSPSLEVFREPIYLDIHIHFFILGAMFLYILLYRSRIIPRFISVWGLLATLLLFLKTVINLYGIKSPVFDFLLIPMILNELFLAVWLIGKGINFENKSWTKQAEIIIRNSG